MTEKSPQVTEIHFGTSCFMAIQLRSMWRFIYLQFFIYILYCSIFCRFLFNWLILGTKMDIQFGVVIINVPILHQNKIFFAMRMKKSMNDMNIYIIFMQNLRLIQTKIMNLFKKQKLEVDSLGMFVGQTDVPSSDLLTLFVDSRETSDHLAEFCL